MSEGTGGGTRIACGFVAGSLAVALFYGTYSFDVGDKLPWKFDISQIELVAERAAAEIKIPEPPAPRHTVQNVSGQEQVKAAVWKFLRDNGLTREQAAGIMGNIQAESGFRPSVQERGNGIGYGLCQWSFGRRAALEQTARDQKVKVSSLSFQLDYLYREMHIRQVKGYANEWDMMSRMKSVEDALVAFHNEFERSHLMKRGTPQRIRQAVLDARLGFAMDFYNNPSRYP